VLLVGRFSSAIIFFTTDLFFRMHLSRKDWKQEFGPGNKGSSIGIKTTDATDTAIFKGENWSGREDLNLRPPGPEPGALARLRYAPTGRHPGTVTAARVEASE
jgi:hypothetical protein